MRHERALEQRAGISHHVSTHNGRRDGYTGDAHCPGTHGGGRLYQVLKALATQAHARVGGRVTRSARATSLSGACRDGGGVSAGHGGGLGVGTVSGDLGSSLTSSLLNVLELLDELWDS